MDCYLYVAVSEDLKFCKIGCTKNPKARFYSLRREAFLKFGSQVRPWAVWPTQSWADERELLDRFEVHAIKPKGEWFIAHPEILDFARSMPLDEGLVGPMRTSCLWAASDKKEKPQDTRKLYCPLCLEEATLDHIQENEECSHAIASLAARYRVSKRKAAAPGYGRGNKKGEQKC